MVKHMGIKLLLNMLTEFCTFPFFTVMANETTDAAIQKEVTLLVHWVNDELQINEDFWDYIPPIQLMQKCRCQ